MHALHGPGSSEPCSLRAQVGYLAFSPVPHQSQLSTTLSDSTKTGLPSRKRTDGPRNWRSNWWGLLRRSALGSASANKFASDTFISRLVGVNGTPQHRSPSREIRMSSFCLFCLTPRDHTATLRKGGGWATSPLLFVPRIRAYEAGLWAYSGYVHS